MASLTFMSYADMLLATVPAAPPTRKNQRTTSCPAPISAKVPYQRGSRLILSALEWVSIVASFISVRTEDVLNPLANETREFLFQAINRLMQAALQHEWVSAGSRNRQASSLCSPNHGILRLCSG